VQSNLPTVLAILVVLAMSVGVGLINGLLVARAGINSLISTLGMSTVIIGLTQAYTGGRMINGEIASLVMLGRRTFLGLPFPVFYMIGIAIIAWYVLEQTPLGRYLYAIGGSKDAAKLAGINVRRLTLGSFMFSGLLAGIAGVMLAAKLGSGNPSAGSPLLMPALAAAFLGAAAIKVGTFNVAGTVVAVFTLATGVAGLQLMGAAWWIEPIFNGLALILAVGLTRFLRREEL
jgi:ribose transport system permease protein